MFHIPSIAYKNKNGNKKTKNLYKNKEINDIISLIDVKGA